MHRSRSTAGCGRQDALGDCAYGPEGSGDRPVPVDPADGRIPPAGTRSSRRRQPTARNRWTSRSPSGRSGSSRSAGRRRVSLSAITAVGTERSTLKLTIEPGTPTVDVVNNAGGIVLRDGYGADRGFQEVDEGQYDEPAEVFTACGNGMAMRTAVGRELGWFDDDFFMYYEDTDLSWRWRSDGWSIRYAADRGAAARALGHEHRVVAAVAVPSSTATGC